MKKCLVIIFVVVCAALIGLFTAYKLGVFYTANEQQKRYMQDINSANSIIWYYGELDPGKEITINYKKIQDFTEETIGDADNCYSYHGIIIWDFDGKMDISDEELLLIKKYCEEKYYDLMYYGTDHIDQFIKCGFLSSLPSGDWGFTYNGSYWSNRKGMELYSEPYLLTGLWLESDNEFFDVKDRRYMWKFAIQYIVDLIKSSMGET